MSRLTERLYVLVNGSEDVERSEKYIEGSEVISNIKSYSWEAEFIIIDWLSISTAMKTDIESVVKRVSTEYILVEDTEDC